VDNLAPRQSSPEVSFTGTWATSIGQNPYGSSSLYSAGSGIDTYTWKPPVLTSGQTCAYQVFVRWTQRPDRSAMVPITVSGHTGGPTTRTFDERTGGGVWTLHGTYTFPAGAQPTVQVTDQNGQASADAVRFVPSGTPTASTSPCAGELIVDNLGPGQRSARVSFTGSWTTSSGVNPYGANSLVSVGSGVETYTWTPPVFSTAQVCTYQVFVRWTQHLNRSVAVPITVSGHAGGATTRTFDERTGGGVWTLHGTYTFPAGSQGTVQVTDQNGQASADAVRFIPAL
jgi:hypothetical protein